MSLVLLAVVAAVARGSDDTEDMYCDFTKDQAVFTPDPEYDIKTCPYYDADMYWTRPEPCPAGGTWAAKEPLDCASITSEAQCGRKCIANCYDACLVSGDECEEQWWHCYRAYQLCTWDPCVGQCRDAVQDWTTHDLPIGDAPESDPCQPEACLANGRRSGDDLVDYEFLDGVYHGDKAKANEKVLESCQWMKDAFAKSEAQKEDTTECQPGELTERVYLNDDCSGVPVHTRCWSREGRWERVEGVEGTVKIYETCDRMRKILAGDVVRDVQQGWDLGPRVRDLEFGKCQDRSFYIFLPDVWPRRTIEPQDGKGEMITHEFYEFGSGKFRSVVECVDHPVLMGEGAWDGEKQCSFTCDAEDYWCPCNYEEGHPCGGMKVGDDPNTFNKGACRTAIDVYCDEKNPDDEGCALIKAWDEENGKDPKSGKGPRKESAAPSVRASLAALAATATAAIALL